MSTPLFIDKLSNGLNRCHLRNQRIIVAVSGGADSVALLLGLNELRHSFSMDLVVAHLNHALRGAESDADANWVNQLASQLQLPFDSTKLSTSDWTAANGGMEENARKFRYQYFDQIATQRHAQAIAIAHTADDQAETVLHNLVRGTGISGLRGMQRIRTTSAGHHVIRPMLDIRRSMVEQFLAERHQTYRTDSSNADLKITRNRIRQQIMPQLRELLNPNVESALCRLAEQAADLEHALDVTVQTLLNYCTFNSQLDTCHVDVTDLNNTPRHFVRELFRQIWVRQKWSLQGMGFDDWNRLADSLESKSTITLPGRIEARFRTDGMLVLRRLPGSSSTPTIEPMGDIVTSQMTAHSAPPATS